jgi:D-alanyl-D-alanine dipeptidase
LAGWALLALFLLLEPVLGHAAQGRIPAVDRGIYGDLDAKVRLSQPSWLAVQRCRRAGLDLQLVLGALVFATPAETGAALPACPPLLDSDGDGLADPWDILLGAKKTALDAAPYGSPYRTLAYPGGDVPRGEGVCTDVVIRALRNAGIDLQVLLHQDIAAAPQAYPMVRKANPHIDHRRVKTLLPFFVRHWHARDPSSARLGDWLPGDIVFMDTLAARGPDHIGVVSDQLGPSGKPWIVNSWTDGYSTAEMDLLAFVPVTHRFRAPQDMAGDLAQVQRQLGWQVPAATRQVLLVRAAHAAATQGTLTRWQRRAGDWQQVGAPVAVDLGRAGLAWGRGLLPQALPAKREGDGRSPQGVFALGVAFGRDAKPAGVQWPWQRAQADDRWVDDPASPLYNRWVKQGQLAGASAEVLARGDGLYDLALVVLHNAQPVQAGAGSAIFLHLASGSPTQGCTALQRGDLLTLLRWLRPGDQPLLVQVADPL